LLNVPSEKVRTVWLGVSEHFHPASQNEVKEMRVRHDLTETYILFLGTLEPRKNLDGLLRAYQVLRAEYNDPPPLLIVGQRGWLFDDLFSLAKDLKVNDHILWREEIPYHDLPALYSGAALLCLPSHYEGFGFPPLEAMACGTPVIVANRASLPEIVGEAAILVEPDAPADIASAISRLLGDSELAMSLRARGLERVRLFDWTETARQALTVYQHVLDNS
jgi:glycosyltransferase involved in cell wall biosynthesis